MLILHLQPKLERKLATHNFKKIFKKQNFNKPKKTSTSVAPTTQEGSSHPNSKFFNLNKLEGIQCRECGGIGQIQTMC